MTQIEFFCPATVTSTDATAAATTGGPFELPVWAPDIEWATTSQDNAWLFMIGGTTSISLRKKWSIASYTKRTFGLADGVEGKVTSVLITYLAAGELVRT